MNQPNQTTKNIILSYLSYLSLFVGAGFVSGAIVHSGDIAQIPKYVVIGVVGISLFLTGSFVQEFILNKDANKIGIVKFFFLSLLLSIGIGMISGGTQHFSDFPVYSSYLIPLGLIISLIAYLLKNNFHITTKLWAVITTVFLLISIPLFFGLNSYAQSLVACEKQVQKDICTEQGTHSDSHALLNLDLILRSLKVAASGGHDTAPTCQNAMTQHDSPVSMNHGETMVGMDKMAKNATDDKSFIEYMIPHHQEAVDSSTQILNATTDLDLKVFTQNVITNQSKEISQMKTWYKEWFGKDYTPALDAMSMMGGMKTKTGLELESEYVKGMLGHHSGAIDMAKKIKEITKRQELIKLANDIISSQAEENKILESWNMTKYKENNNAKDPRNN